MLPRLGALDRSALVVAELPGHAPGFAPLPGFEANVDAVAQRIHTQLQQPYHLVGYSLGARLALGLLARYRQRIARVSLIGVNPGLGCERQRRERCEADSRWINRLRRDGLADFVDAWEKLPLFASQAHVDPQRLARQRAIRMGHDAEQLAQSLEQMGLAQMPDYRDALRRWNRPLRVIAGALDHKFRALAEEIAAIDPNFRLVTLDGCGHNPPLETPAACALALVD